MPFREENREISVNHETVDQTALYDNKQIEDISKKTQSNRTTFNGKMMNIMHDSCSE